MKQKLDLHYWQQQAAASPQERVELITARIERACTDIAPTYEQWRNLGFALAEGLGEQGRTYFHRLSRFYSRYQAAEADKQYTACLRSSRGGITLATFFHLARQAGIDLAGPLLPNCQIAKLPPAPVFSPHGQPTAPQAPTGPTASRPSRPSGAEYAPSPYSSGAGRSAAPRPVGAGSPQPQPAEEPPVFSDDVYASLPRLLTEVCSYGLSSEDTDLLLLGSLTALSSCLTRVSGVYGQRQVYPNLYLFVHAPASAGKGRLTLCRHLVSVVHADLRTRNRREWEEYRRAKAQNASQRRSGDADEPQQPPVRMLFLPANSTATALFQALNDNDGQALMFETEGDTLATTFRSEHGNYSDGLRKAFHHESIAYNRRKDREYVEIAQPRLSVLLSGTPRQISTLIPDAENGLFSRFLFYNLPLRPLWYDVFATVEGETMDSRFSRLGGRFFQFYRRLSQADPIGFTFTPEQQKAFNAFFAQLQDEGIRRYGAGLLPSIRRLGLSAYRICMVLSVLRLMDYEGDAPLPDRLICGEEDFRTMQLLVPVLLQHTALAYQALVQTAGQPAEAAVTLGENTRQRRRTELLMAMPATFCRQDWQQEAALLHIPVRTADRYLIELCNSGQICKQAFDSYRKGE